MRVVLDEGVPRRLAALLSDRGVDATAFPEKWQGFSDRQMIETAVAQGFSALITQDRNMPFQRPLTGTAFAVLIVPELDRQAVLAKVGEIAARLRGLEAGRYALLGLDGSLAHPPVKPFTAR